MTIVTDPDDLDRFKIVVDPIAETISLRGLGAVRHAIDSTGDSDGTSTFVDTGAAFVATDSIVAGDILSIISDPADNGGIIGHYRVVTPGATTLVVDRNITASTAGDLDYQVAAAGTTGNVAADVSDGVTLQALYSFLKEEWRTLAGGLGNAEDLIQFDFPFTAITREQMIMGGVNGDSTSAWGFATANGTTGSETEGETRELVRTGGWQERNAADVVLREYSGVVTLGTIDSDAQVYFQQGDTTAVPVDYKLVGAVDQAVLVRGPDVGPDSTGTGFVFAATTITRNDGGDWSTDGYLVGDFVIIRAAEDPANNSTSGRGPITVVGAGVDGAITIASESMTVNADDQTVVFSLDHRRYLSLRVRKKARTYDESDLADIGVTTLEALVNRFPLSHATDAAITIQDGVFGGDSTAAIGDIFQEIETHTTATDGVTETAASATGDTFTLTSAGAGFTLTVARTLQVLQVGDSVELTDGADVGVYEIQATTSDSILTLFKEPLLTYTGGESSRAFTVRTGMLDTGAANATLADVDTATGTLASVGSTFDVDTAIGDRVVTTGDMVRVTAGTAGVIGVYKVVSRTNATTLVLNTSDQLFAGETSQTYEIFRPGMHLQRFETTVGDIANDPSFNDADPDTITRGAGDFVADGYTAGMAVTVTAATVSANNGTFIIDSLVTLTLTLIAEETLTTDATDTTAVLAGDTGIIRTIDSVVFPFHWRLFTNGGTLSQIFQFLQRELRRTTDIDEGNGAERGDITNLLMSFSSPTGTTIDLFPDDIANSELNNVTYQGVETGVDRNNAFLVGLTLQVSQNLIDSANARVVVFFSDPDGTPSTGDEFGTNGAIIVQDDVPVNMNFTTVTANISTTYDYTNNAQGGRTPNTDAPVTVVAIGDDLAQHVLVTATITRVNTLTIAVSTALERNYSNP